PDHRDDALDPLLTVTDGLHVLRHGRIARGATPARLAPELGATARTRDALADGHPVFYPKPAATQRSAQGRPRADPTASRLVDRAPQRLDRERLAIAVVVERHDAAPITTRALLPDAEALPEVLAIDPEHLADVLVREDPRLVRALDPGLGVLEHLATLA